MDEFTVVALALTIVACLFVVLPLLKTRQADPLDLRHINAALFKSRLVEISQELDRGDLNQDEFERLKIELQRRLLDDVSTTQASVVATTHQSKVVLLALLLFIPLTSWFIYFQTGAKADWEITQILKQARLADAAGKDSRAIVQQLAARLHQHIEKKADDAHYLMLLANSEMSLQNYPSAAAAYLRVTTLVPNDPTALAQYAQALYLSSDRQMTDKVSAIVDRTLALQPNQPIVLGMLGIYNFEQSNFQAAIDYWQRLLPSLGPVSPNAQMIKQGIEQARTLLAKEQGVPLSPQIGATSTAATPKDATGSTPIGLQVNVSIDSRLNAPTTAQVFVFARAITGPKMPLAVARLTVADLPTRVTLDDSMAMAAGLKLSNFDQVEVVARVSKKGIANRGAGDMEGIITPITVSATKTPISLLIDQLLP